MLFRRQNVVRMHSMHILVLRGKPSVGGVVAVKYYVEVWWCYRARIFLEYQARSRPRGLRQLLGGTPRLARACQIIPPRVGLVRPEYR